MSSPRRRTQPQQTPLPGVEPAPDEELTLADHIPTPGVVLSALYQVIPEIPGTVFEMVDVLGERLPIIRDIEAGQ